MPLVPSLIIGGLAGFASVGCLVLGLCKAAQDERYENADRFLDARAERNQR